MICPASSHLYLNLLKQNLEKKGVEILDISWFGKQFPYSLFQFLKGKIEGANILHLHWMPFNKFFMMKMVKKISEKTNIKMVWTIHNLLPHTPRYGNIDTDKEAMRYMASWASAGIVHCEKTKEDFYKSYKIDLPLFVIPHGNFNDFAYIKSSDEARDRLNISQDKIVLLMFPPNRWTKGIETFVKVVKKLPHNYIGLLAGNCEDPSIRSYLYKVKRKYPHKFLTFLRYIPDNEVGYYFAAADIFFIPYERVTTSGSVMYAMAYKKPIVSTPKGNLYMLVKNGVNGYLCGNVKEMITAIKGIDRDKAAKMGEKSRRIAAKFNWIDIARDTIKVYKYVGAE